MARHRTATNILELRGAFKNHPERRKERAKEPEPKGPFPRNPPSDFNEQEKDMWREIVRACAVGVLTADSVFAVEICTKLMLRFRDEGARMPSGHLTQLRIHLGLLGLSPSDRARLQAI